MLISKLRLKPGDKVRFLDDEFTDYDIDMGMYFFTAGKGSTGTVVSGKGIVPDPLDEAYIRYPIKLEKVFQPSCPHPYVVGKAGGLAQVCVKFLEKLDYINPHMVFSLDRIRVILSEDNSLLKPEDGHRLLLLSFTIENSKNQTIPDMLTARASLSYRDVQGNPLTITATPTMSGKVCASGQVIFQIPEPIYQYKFRFELPGMGIVEREIILQTLQIGDAVLLKYGYAYGYDYFRSTIFSDEYPTNTLPFFNPSLRRTSAGSYGILVPFSKFQSAYIRCLERFDPNLVRINQASIERICAEVKLQMEEGLAYPVELKEIASPSPNDCQEDTKYCRAGDIVVMSALALKKRRGPVQKPIFSIEWIRIFLPEDDCPRQPASGNKLLQIDFIFEHPAPHLLQTVYPPQLALTLHEASDSVITVEPMILDLPDKKFLRGGDFAGKVFFEVPGGSQVYKVSLEFASIGQWSQIIQLPPLQPGDRVRVSRDFSRDRHPKYTKITAGSLGRIVSFTEYCADYKRLGKEFDQNERIPAEHWLELEYPFHEKEKLNEKLEYPVRLEKLFMPSDEDAKNLVKEGEIFWIHGCWLEKME